MSLNNYMYDVAFVRDVSTLLPDQIISLEALGLEYYPEVCGEHLQVWCGGLRGFQLVDADCIINALSYEGNHIRSRLFFDSVDALIAALT